MLSGSVVLRFWDEVDTTLSLLHKKYAIPRPIQAPPTCTLVDCCVVEVGDRAVWSNSSAWSQIATSILPPGQNNRPKSPYKNNAATPSPGSSSSRTRVH